MWNDVVNVKNGIVNGKLNMWNDGVNVKIACWIKSWNDEVNSIVNWKLNIQNDDSELNVKIT